MTVNVFKCPKPQTNSMRRICSVLWLKTNISEFALCAYGVQHKKKKTEIPIT